MQELRGNIRVFCRCRPPSQRELIMTADDASSVVVTFPGEGEVGRPVGGRSNFGYGSQRG